jgi:putative ABC transport system ATP-binding protein
VIRLQGVAKEYRSGRGGAPVRALAGIDLEVPDGGSLAVTGPSGCGKSTLLSLVGGLETPSRGTVLLDDVELSALPEQERCRLRRDRFGFVFQADNLLPFLTARENVLLAVALGGGADGLPRVDALLAELGLADQRDRLPDQLSGGQRLRVAIARAVVHRPAVLLADEPTGSLDADTADVILDLLVGLQRSTGAVLVMVTHDRAAAARLDRTVRLRDGVLVDG